MPLHKRSSVHDDVLSSVYADRDLTTTLPSKRFPAKQMRPVDAFQAISDELLLDGNARQNLATFCQTWEEPEVHRLALTRPPLTADDHDQVGPFTG